MKCKLGSGQKGEWESSVWVNIVLSVIPRRKMVADTANIFEGFKEEDLSVAHTNKQMWKIEENVKI